MPTTELAEQQQLIRAALIKLANRAEPLSMAEATWLDMLRYALADHEDPDEGCLAEPGTECVAVTRARQILAGAKS